MKLNPIENMPPLSNRRHELFALEVASGAPLAVAYISAGYKEGRGYDCRHNASRLRNQPHVKGRVNEILTQSAERAVVGIGWVQLQLVDVANGKVPAKTVTNSKGETDEVYDRMGALAVLARTLGAAGEGTNVNVQITRIERVIVAAPAGSSQLAPTPPVMPMQGASVPSSDARSIVRSLIKPRAGGSHP